MTGGYAGRIAFVDLTTGKVEEEKLDEDTERDFIGGYGIGVRILFERQKPGIDPLGPENIIGFITGPLTGTQAPSGCRYMAVSKSPLTGGWGDANSGGYFGSKLKSAGWDAIFFSGIAPSPKYALITEQGIELRDADHLWGKDTVDTEAILGEELGTQKIRVASIGPASERRSLISGIVNDGGRIAARSGLGAVMGSKRLKALAVSGGRRVAIADEGKLEQLRRTFLKELRESQGFPKRLGETGTAGGTKGLITGAATPIKNFLLAGEQAFPTLDKVADANIINKYRVRRYSCANCPIACGAICSVSEGPYSVTHMHRPEYETLAAFGPLCLNDDLLSIMKLNDMCNRNGLDTISSGCVIAFAMECFENGIISAKDTDGIQLNWGDSQAMIAILDKMIRRQGIGDILADGVKVAAQKIGKGAEQYAMHVGGQEPGMHHALCLPSRGTGYVCDPTPGRHTAAIMNRIDLPSAPLAPYPELQFPSFKRYEYKGKGIHSVTMARYWQIGTCAGLCLFPVIFFGNYPLLDFVKAVTGWNIDMAEALKTGARIQTLRQAFNLREGIQQAEVKLPPRMAGRPPMNEGPLAGITIDIETLTREYNEAMGWDPDTGYIADATLERLGLKQLVDIHRSKPLAL
jgi:aldehyde:ferredoxin oxidoreductase